jgi:hypothetical protein
MISLSGIDISFMKTRESQDHLRRLRNLHSAQKQHFQGQRSDIPSPRVMSDLSSVYPEGGFKSPVDGTFITSRSQLAAHNRRHGVRQCGECDPKAWTDHVTKEHQKRLAEPTPGVNFEWSKFGD